MPPRFQPVGPEPGDRDDDEETDCRQRVGGGESQAEGGRVAADHVIIEVRSRAAVMIPIGQALQERGLDLAPAAVLACSLSLPGPAAKMEASNSYYRQSAPWQEHPDHGRHRIVRSTLRSDRPGGASTPSGSSSSAGTSSSSMRSRPELGRRSPDPLLPRRRARSGAACCGHSTASTSSSTPRPSSRCRRPNTTRSRR